MSCQFNENARKLIVRAVGNSSYLLSEVTRNTKSAELVREIYEKEKKKQRKKQRINILISLARNPITDDNILMELPQACYEDIIERKKACSFDVQKRVIDHFLRDVIISSVRKTRNKENDKIILGTISNEQINDDLKIMVIKTLSRNKYLRKRWLDRIANEINILRTNTKILNELYKIDPSLVFFSLPHFGIRRKNLKLETDKYNAVVRAIKDCLASGKNIRKIGKKFCYEDIIFGPSTVRCVDDDNDNGEIADIIFDLCEKLKIPLDLSFPERLYDSFLFMRDLKVSDELIIKLTQFCEEESCEEYREATLRFLYSHKHITMEKKLMLRLGGFIPKNVDRYFK